MNYSAMTTKAIQAQIQRYENQIKDMKAQIKSTKFNYRNQTCLAALEMVHEKVAFNEAEIAYNNEHIILMKAELENRA